MYKAFTILLAAIFSINLNIAAQAAELPPFALMETRTATIKKVKIHADGPGTLTVEAEGKCEEIDILRREFTTLSGAVYSQSEGRFLHIKNPQITCEEVASTPTLKMVKITRGTTTCFTIFIADMASQVYFTEQDDKPHTEFRTTEEAAFDEMFPLCTPVIDMGQRDTKGFTIPHSESAANTAGYFTTPCRTIVRFEGLERYNRMMGQGF